MSNTLKPFWNRNKWLIRPAAILFFFLIPITLSVYILFTNREMYSEAYRELFKIFKTLE